MPVVQIIDGEAVELTSEEEADLSALGPPLPRRRVPKSLIIERLTDQQVADVLAILTPKQAERWRAPDQPSVYFDDPDTVAALTAIGADVEAVMAPPGGA